MKLERKLIKYILNIIWKKILKSYLKNFVINIKFHQKLNLTGLNHSKIIVKKILKNLNKKVDNNLNILISKDY